MAVSLNHPTYTTKYQPAQPKAQCACGCPTCGGLECLCRPRFFAGQMLSDEDLNRLDRYIIDKNRLHNRYLHGWGVVCGLEVLCHPCDGYVTVRAGYALSPCGDDIIVCNDDAVNICDLLQRCRERPAYDCEPLRPYGVGDDCADLEEEWVLAICYDERATRGVMPLRQCAPSNSCGRCNCGGAHNCGCGCHGQSHSHTSQSSHTGHATQAVRKVAKLPPAQCEPTVTCETYRFELRRLPQEREGHKQPVQSEFAHRVLCCYQELVHVVPLEPQGDNRTPAKMRNWCCAVKAAFQELLVRHGLHDCHWYEQLAAFSCPPLPLDMNPNQLNPEYAQKIHDHVTQMTVVGSEFFRSCICSALLPPCPPLVEDGCVMLASIRLRRRDCHILSVCNLHHRRMVLSVPALQYWLSPLPIMDPLRKLLARLCCDPLTNEDPQQPHFGIAAFPPPGAAMPDNALSPLLSKQLAEFLQFLSEAWQKSDTTVNPFTFTLDALGVLDSQNQPLLSPLERSHPLESILLNQVAWPLINALRPEPTGGAAPAADVGAQLAALQAMVANLQAEVKALKTGGKKPKP